MRLAINQRPITRRPLLAKLGFSQYLRRGRNRARAAFTMFELMVVVGILGVVAAIGIPSLAYTFNKEGMRKAVSDIVEACSRARAEAILTGQNATMSIRAYEGTISAASFSATLPENVKIEFMGVNFIPDMQELEEVKVRFFPNGTSDEFAMLLRSQENEVRQISLDVITGLADVKEVQ